MTGSVDFPKGFIWGAATAAYQVEGAAFEDGKGESIWDRFSHQPGNIERDETGDVACDQYHRYQEDISLMQKLGLLAYRFSISWPRIYPQGYGAVNQKGLDHYDRLVDALLAAGIDPWVTLYHWDLPQALQDEGGWPERKLAGRFADYAYTVAQRLADRVHCWMTFNEPSVFIYHGYRFGGLAPGHKSHREAFHGAHTVSLAHGLAYDAVKAIRSDVKVGITHATCQCRNLTGDEASEKLMADLWDEYNGVFLEPVLCGTFPESVRKRFAGDLPTFSAADLGTANRCDFVGIQYYFDRLVAHGKEIPMDRRLPEFEYTEMGWPVTPDGLYNNLVTCWEKYPPREIMITENGMALTDEIDADGRVCDVRRQKYLREHLKFAHRAIRDGVPLTAYFVWSFMDNFEWACGYRPRFGIVYVDYATQKRTIKDSGYLFADIIRNNGF